MFNIDNCSKGPNEKIRDITQNGGILETLQIVHIRKNVQLLFIDKKCKYIKTPASGKEAGGNGKVYLRRALRRTGTIKSATAPPMRAVKSWGQLKVAGSAFSMGAFMTPEARRFSDRTPQMSHTTMA